MDIQEQIIRQTAGNLYWKDVNGNYLGCNENMAKIFKLHHPKEVVGKNDYDFFLDDVHVKKIIENDKFVMKTGKETEFEEIGADETGQLLTFKTKKVPLRDSENKIIGIIGVSIDVTKEKEAEKAKNDFISNMQHDLRTPFTGISGLARILYDFYSDKYPEIKEFLEQMIKSCKQWEEIHHRILQALRYDGNVLNIETFSINEELDKIKELMISTAFINSIKLSFHPLKPADDFIIKTDRLKLHLILMNLISNALNFTKKGQVDVVVVRDDKFFNFQIIDTGIGIPADKFEYIFDQFTKLSPSNEHGDRFEGVGNGLFISRIYAKNLGGCITAQSQVGKGSTFTLRLPVEFE